MSQVADLTADLFQEEVLNSTTPVLLDFWAPWCGPCRMLKPVMEQVADHYGERLKVMAVNVDEQPELAQAFGVQGIPMVVLMKDKKPLDAFSGYQPLPTVMARIDKKI